MAIHLPSQEELASLTSDEAAEIAAVYLAHTQPGRQPLRLFTEICRLAVLSTVEIVPLRIRAGQAPEVLLTQRDSSDPWWPKQWHLPGTAILPTDIGPEHTRHGYDSIMPRLYQGELGDALVVQDTRLFDAGTRRGPRGSEQTVFRWVLVDLREGYDEPPVGRFFDATTVADNPPHPGLIVTHDESIRRAVAHHAVFAALPPELQADFR